MTVKINGPCVRIAIPAKEATSRVEITLPDGYSYETINIIYSNNVKEIALFFLVNTHYIYHIPPVNSRSPSTLSLLVTDPSKDAEIRIFIEKFGQIPDPNYFSNVAFKPISVVGEDGNEYNVIPSDQFK